MNIEKEKRAIEYLKTFQPPNDPYYLCYSGGKDSDTIRILADLAGVDYDCVHNLTTVDAPETVNYVKSVMETYGERKSYKNEEGLPVRRSWIYRAAERKHVAAHREKAYAAYEDGTLLL